MKKTVLRLASSIQKWSSWDLWKSVGLCFLGAIISFSIATLGKDHWNEWGREILIHIQNAFLVAGILTMTIDYNARRQSERAARANLFEDVLEHVMPREVVDEIDSFLRANVIRRDCRYLLEFDKPYDEMPKGYFVIRRELSFEVENLTTHEATFSVKSSYSAHPDRISSGWDRKFHTGLEINEIAVPNLESYLSERDGLHFLDYPLSLAPRQKATVNLFGEEPSRVDAGSNSYTQGTTVIGIEVVIHNFYPEAIDEVKVFMHHPAYNTTTQRRNRYILNRAFLPGQGFEVRWRTSGSIE